MIQSILENIIKSIYHSSTNLDNAINNLFSNKCFPDYIYFEFDSEKPYKVKVSSSTGKTFNSSDFRGLYIKKLQNYLQQYEPKISFSYSAKWFPKYDTFTLYFESDPESFKAFQNRIPKIRGLKLELKEKQQELNPTDLNTAR